MRCEQIAWLFLLLFQMSCGPTASDESEPIPAQIIEVACGHCIYEMPGQELTGCPWATEIDGEYYLITGPVPLDHHRHDPDGICSMPRQARVIGQVREEYFVASEFALLPAENVPESSGHDHRHEH